MLEKNWKRNIIVFWLSINSVLVTTGKSDPLLDLCDQTLKACNTLVKQQTKELEISDLIIKEQNNIIINTETQLIKKTEELNSWYRNPFVVGTMGILAGSLAATIIITQSR